MTNPQMSTNPGFTLSCTEIRHGRGPGLHPRRSRARVEWEADLPRVCHRKRQKAHTRNEPDRFSHFEVPDDVLISRMRFATV